MDTVALDRRVARVEGVLASKRKQREELASVVSAIGQDVKDLGVISELFNQLTQQSQQMLKIRLEQLVSYSLSRVFDREFRFIVEFKSMRKNTVVEFKLASEETGWEPVELTEARGGGVCELVGFMIRLVFLLYLRNTQRQILFLDEPFSWVSKEYVNSLMLLIKELADKTGVQFVIVTHNEALAGLGDKQYRFWLEQGQTRIQEVSDVVSK